MSCETVEFLKQPGLKDRSLDSDSSSNFDRDTISKMGDPHDDDDGDVVVVVMEKLVFQMLMPCP